MVSKLILSNLLSATMFATSSASRIAAHQGRRLLTAIGNKSSRCVSAQAFKTFSKVNHAGYFPLLAGAAAAGVVITQFGLEEQVFIIVMSMWMCQCSIYPLLPAYVRSLHMYLLTSCRAPPRRYARPSLRTFQPRKWRRNSPLIGPVLL